MTVATYKHTLPYYSFNQYLRDKFGTKVHKVTVDAQFTCPNRDGSKGWGGCTFCNNEGFSVNTRTGNGSCGSVEEQLLRGINFKRKRYKAEKFLAYFQAYTNTYGPVERLKSLYDEALSVPDVVGLDVGTRPDCTGNEILDLIQSYAERTELWLEYGLQSSHDRTLKWINRGHNYACFVDAIKRAQGRGIHICVHVILGLPGETHEDMMITAKRLSKLDFQGIKIHLLHIMHDTQMEKQYRQDEIHLLTLEEYASLVTDFLEYIPPQVTIHRLTGDAPDSVLIGPEWCLNKAKVLQTIHQEMLGRNFQQGSKLG